MPEENGFSECVRCFSSIRDDLCESLFLEDLKRRDFEMINPRTESMSFDHVALLMRVIGKFHALSFALRDQQKEKFDELTSHLIEQFWPPFESEF